LGRFDQKFKNSREFGLQTFQDHSGEGEFDYDMGVAEDFKWLAV